MMQKCHHYDTHKSVADTAVEEVSVSDTVIEVPAKEMTTSQKPVLVENSSSEDDLMSRDSLESRGIPHLNYKLPQDEAAIYTEDEEHLEDRDNHHYDTAIYTEDEEQLEVRDNHHYPYQQQSRHHTEDEEQLEVRDNRDHYPYQQQSRHHSPRRSFHDGAAITAAARQRGLSPRRKSSGYYHRNRVDGIVGGTTMAALDALGALDVSAQGLAMSKLPPSHHPQPPPPPPPKSPTYSYRSTIDLLPSSGRHQGLAQQIVVTFACCLGPLACGFAFAYNLTKNPAENMRTSGGAWRTHIYLLGCLIGGFFSGLLLTYGRKVVLLVTMVPMALSWLIVIFSTQPWMVFLFQGISGMCTGIIMIMAQVYVAEISVAKIRGAISSAPLLAFQVGSLVCYMLGEILMWKNLAIVGVCIAIPFFFSVVLCMPQSPRYLILVRPNDALSTLQWLRGLDTDVMEEYHDITDTAEMDLWQMSCKDLSRPTFWRPLLISCGLMFLYSMTGVYSFTVYGMELFNEVSKSYLNVAYFIVTTVMIIAITLESILVDQIGRKLLLLLSLTIMSASAFVLGLFLFLKDLHKVDNYFEYQWIAEVFCVVLFTFAHGTGVGPIAWVTLGEIFGSHHKWLGITFSSMVLWASMLGVDMLFHEMRAKVATGGLFWFHCVICVGGYIFILLVFRELREQPLDNITKTFTRKHESLIETFIAKV